MAKRERPAKRPGAAQRAQQRKGAGSRGKAGNPGNRRAQRRPSGVSRPTAVQVTTSSRKERDRVEEAMAAIDTGKAFSRRRGLRTSAQGVARRPPRHRPTTPVTGAGRKRQRAA